MSAVGVALPMLLFFEPARERDPRAQAHARENEELEKRLFCACCRHPVTGQEQRIAMLGAHAHTCTNPQGLTFHLGCFREAPGAAAVGPATTEHTWFPGYAWRVAACARCGVHLGWRFEGSDGGFYGLIVKQLTSAARG